LQGLTRCSKWTGVPLSVLFQEVGVQPQARWLVAEGADACRQTRSVPMDKALDDTVVAFAQKYQPKIGMRSSDMPEVIRPLIGLRAMRPLEP